MNGRDDIREVTQRIIAGMVLVLSLALSVSAAESPKKEEMKMSQEDKDQATLKSTTPEAQRGPAGTAGVNPGEALPG